MLKNIVMPQASQDLVPARVVRWLFSEGDAVKKGDVVCEVESEKAVIEVSSPADGLLLKIVTPEDEEADVFATIGFVGDKDAQLPAEFQDAAAAPQAPAAPTPEEKAVSAPETPAESPRGAKKIFITPLAKKLAREFGVDFTTIKGSGPNGRIVADDVRAAKEAPRAAAPAPAAPATVAAPAMPTSVKVDTSAPGTTVSLNRIRKVTGQRMQLSKQVAPHFYVTVAVDMTDALAYREVYNKKPGLEKDDRLSINDMVVRACAIALKEFPEVNSSVIDESTLMMWDDINIGIATALEDGLVVPVLEHADWLGLAQVPAQTRRLFRLAKEGKQASLAPSRFTISNLGMFNVSNFSAIINPPEAAILAVSSIETQVMPPKGEHLGVRLREMMNITVSIDHRVGDGVLAARFANRIRELLETPQLME